MAEDLNDIYPRKVYFFPQSGKVLVKKLKQLNNDTMVKREKDYAAGSRVLQWTVKSIFSDRQANEQACHGKQTA